MKWLFAVSCSVLLFCSGMLLTFYPFVVEWVAWLVFGSLVVFGFRVLADVIFD